MAPSKEKKEKSTTQDGDKDKRKESAGSEPKPGTSKESDQDLPPNLLKAREIAAAILAQTKEMQKSEPQVDGGFKR